LSDPNPQANSNSPSPETKETNLPVGYPLSYEVQKSQPLTLAVDQDSVKIVQGDCLKAMQVIEQSSVSLCMTSPPYPGVKQPEEDYVTFADPMAFNSCHDFLEQVWRVCYEALEDLGWLAINLYDIPTGESGMYPNVAATIKRCLDIGYVLRETYIWHKGASYSPPSGSWPYPKGLLSANTYEPILIFQKPLKFSQRRRKQASDYSEEQRQRSTLGPTEHSWLMDPVWKIPAEREGRALGHPFTYPVELCERIIRLYSFSGDRVFDPFVGSGTTCEAARIHGRVGLGFELSSKYIQICKDRFTRQSLFG
jgi:modification methylase